MAILDIVTLPEPILRRKARKVTDFGADFQRLVDDMIETMRQAPGVGLAAPQVNSPLSLVVIEYGDDEDENVPKKLFAVANPEITRPSPELVTGVEGCLSIPGFVGEVERHAALTVKGLNRRGQSVTIKAQDWLARIFQHEIDHVNGVLFVDRTDKVWKVEDAPAQVKALD